MLNITQLKITICKLMFGYFEVPNKRAGDKKSREEFCLLQVNLFQKLATSADMLCTKIVLNVKTKQKQQFVYTTCSEGRDAGTDFRQARPIVNSKASKMITR